MGVDIKFQAIPEDCELLRRARIDRDVAEALEFFKLTIEEDFADTDVDVYVLESAKKLVEQHPGLLDRFLYAGWRRWDEIVYLLSPERRVGNWESDNSLIRKAIHGSEQLHPEADTVQGFPIGFVPANDVKVIADYLDAITYDQLHEHYNPKVMFEMGVYKMGENVDDIAFQGTWNEFVDIRSFYRKAATHNEAVIVTID